MSKTKIEWVKNQDGSQGYTINPVKGLCPVACPYCYARSMYKRFHLHKDGTPNPAWDYTIRFEPLDYIKYTAGSKVFVGSTMELFGDWVNPSWLDQIFEWCRRLPDVTFIFLTKRPENLIKWSPFPENCWVGVSATNWLQFSDALGHLASVHATVRFLSLEPLLGEIKMDMLQQMLFPGVISWVIIGQQTPVSQKTTPKIEWIQEIVQAADKAGIPVFLKDNLDGMLHHRHQDNVYGKLFRNDNETLRQELPA